MSYPVSIEDIMTYQAQITNEMFVPPRTIQYFEREEYNSQISESIIRQITGGDLIIARDLYGCPDIRNLSFQLRVNKKVFKYIDYI
jgi:hypothetical protein